MSRQRVPLGKAARATRRVSSGSGVGSSGWSDIDQLTRATGRILNTAEHAPDRRANPQENDFATSVTVGAGPRPGVASSGGGPRPYRPDHPPDHRDAAGSYESSGTGRGSGMADSTG